MIDQLAYSAANHFGELDTYYKSGIQQGIQQGQLKIARQMLVKNFTDEMIKELTGLSQEKLDDLKSSGLDSD